MALSRAALLLLCCLAAGAAQALPGDRRMLLDDRRRVQVDSIEFVNTCRDAGVDFRLHFEFDGDYDWFSKRVTDRIPRPFVDYFCDNIGEVNFQYGDDTNRQDDPRIQRKIAEGQCLNEQIFLRGKGYQGRGPQDSIAIEFPRGKASDFWVALNERDTELSRCDVLRTAWRTADFSRPCRRGSRGCLAWSRVSSRRPVRFVCKGEQERKCAKRG